MSDRILAEVITWNPRGFGFLQDGAGRSYYLHISNIRDEAFPQPGDLLTFLVRDSKNKPGKTEAHDASIVKRSNPAPRFVVPTEPTTGGAL